MATDGWRDHVESKVAGLKLPHFRELVLDTWRHRGFGVAQRYPGEGGDFVAVRRETGGEPETEMVAVSEHGDAEAVRALAEAAEETEGPEVTPVAVARRLSPEASETAHELGVETVDAERLADLIYRGEYYWTLYRWVALSEADEPEIVGSGEAPLRRGESGGKVVVGRRAANRVGVSDGDVVRVGSEAAGVAEKGGLLESDRDYVAVGEGYEDALEPEEGKGVKIEVLDADEARRVYVLSEPGMEEGLAAGVWKGYAPYSGMELSQPYGDGDGEVLTMALEVLPHDYCYVGEETDVVVEGYAGARRVFE